MTEQLINLADIIADPALQPRASMNLVTIAEYQEALDTGAQFPPVVAFFDGGKYWLADGFHRLEAARQLQHSVIRADVRDGGRREALLYSVGANATHGLQRSNADKRRAVLTLLRDAEWRGWSDHEIGRQCLVSAMFVGNVRKELAAEIGPRPAAVTAKRGETVYSVKLPEKAAEQPRPVLEVRGQVVPPLLRRELTQTLPEQMTIMPQPAPVMTLTPTANAPQKLALQPAATAEARDVLATIRIKPGEVLEQRAITVTVAEEFGLGKWATGVYADLTHLVSEMLMRHFLGG